jgi:thiamine-phosphate diphosphorylase
VKRAPFDVMLIADPRASGVLEGLARFRDVPHAERLAVQLRAKDASDAELVALAKRVAEVLPPGAALIVNGRVELARAIAADGVHLPEGSMPASEARERLAEGALVGASCHDETGVARRAAEGCDYVILGPVGAVPGKGAAIDLARFARIARSTTVPIIALGGIASHDDATRVLDAGAAGVALQRGVVDPHTPSWVASLIRG